MCEVYFKRILDTYNVLWNVWKHCLQNEQMKLLKTIKGEDTSYESEYIKQIYNDEINITQFEIEADVLPVIFYEKKVDCFDSFLSEIRKLPREQRLLLPMHSSHV